MESDIWKDFPKAAKQLETSLKKGSALHVNTAKEINETKSLIQKYFRELRPVLKQRQIETSSMDGHFEVLQELCSGRSLRLLYLSTLREIQKIFPTIELQNEYSHASYAGNLINMSSSENKIYETLSKLDPMIAASYLQLLKDLNETTRVSYKGTVHELREILRETLTRLAPDEEVSSSPGFILEKNTSKPTMRQKVVFIFQTRDKTTEEQGIAEKTTQLLERAENDIGNIARGIYTSGSQAAHTTALKKGVLQLKMYLDAVLSDILELS